MGGKSFRDVVEETKPAALMVLVQVVSGVLNILYKLALNDGMDFRVLVAYRYIFAVAFIGPFAFFLERGTLAQNLYLASLKLTSATFANALSNLMPASTFILAVAFRLEILGIRTASGQAKVLGTLVGLGGATLLTLYKGNCCIWVDHNSDDVVHKEKRSIVRLSFQSSAACGCCLIKFTSACVLGAVLIITGLYLVLWGKKKEAAVVDERSPMEAKRESLEVVTVPGSTETLGAKNIPQPNNNEEEMLTLGPKNVCMLNGKEEEAKTNASMP
ncbi:hypothetical protein COCNU_15G001660 [Cocos nucifera]|uniref:WAT1-related protein n=1 Tax=Cocos nucifera TaxID=13894 RepID=A0A8K0IWJ2_COCNU|nr:hypothetical protein COCNU_15G001660 [Cocos nucifera]